MFACYAKKTEDREEIVKAAVLSARKRKRNDDNTVSSTTEKNAKVAIGDTGIEEENRIWEVDSENKDF
jgi:hypothetical protein